MYIIIAVSGFVGFCVGFFTCAALAAGRASDEHPWRGPSEKLHWPGEERP